MKLGIIVTTDRHRDDVIGIVGAALSKGHHVVVFSMDAGTKLLHDDKFHAMSEKGDVSMSFCDLNATERNIQKESLPDAIYRGSQLDNAKMVHEVDRVIRL